MVYQHHRTLCSMQSLSWQLWRLWGNVEKMLPWGGPAPGLSTAPPRYSKLTTGPVWDGSCNLTWFPSLPWETTGSSSCQVSLLCWRPRDGQPLATQALVSGAVNIHSSHWDPALPARAVHSALQNPESPPMYLQLHLWAVPCHVVRKHFGNLKCQTWVIWSCFRQGLWCNELNSPSQPRVALYSVYSNLKLDLNCTLHISPEYFRIFHIIFKDTEFSRNKTSL